MAIAHVAHGTVATGTTSATPTFSQATVAGHLLVAFCTGNGTLSWSTPTGWSSAVGGTSNKARIFYKANCGAGETAPTFTAGASATFVSAQVAEFSGVATSSPFENSGTLTSTASPAVTSTAFADVGNNLICAITSLTYTKKVITTTHALNNGATATNLGNNDATSITTHYRNTYGINTSHAGVDSLTATLTTANISAGFHALASFKPASTVVTKTQTADVRIRKTFTKTQTADAVVTGNVQLSYTFDGGTNGATITTADTGSGNHFDSLNTLAGASHTYTSTDAIAGPLAGLFSTGGTLGTQFAQWDTSLTGTLTEVFGREYTKAKQAFSANRIFIRHRALASITAGARFDGGGHVVLFDAGSTTRYTSTKAFASNETLRIEWHFIHDTVDGHLEARLFWGANLHGTTPDETLGNLTDSWNTGTGVDELSVGQLTNTTNENFVVDQVAISTVTWIGPAVTTVTKSQTASAVVKRTGTTTSQTADAVVKVSGTTKTQTADSFVRKTFTKVQTADSMVRATATRTQTADAVVKTTGTTRTQTADAVRQVTGITKVQTADAFIRKTFTKVQTADAVVAAASTSKSQSADAVVKKSFTKTQSADAFALKSSTKVQTADTAVFAAPANLQAVVISESQINLTWTAVPGATGYDVERDGNVIAVDVATASYNDTGLTSDTTYSYRVRAVM